MKNKKIITLTLAIFGVSIFAFYLGTKTNVDNKIFIEAPKTKTYSNSISMMYETESGSGIYEESKDNTWPTSGYTFNETLSKCEQGSTLSWNDETKQVVMKGNVSDKCYVYFDVKLPTLTEYVKSLYTGTQGENYVYYHDSSLPNGAEDLSYRYAGAYDEVNNYVCFGYDETNNCPNNNLYRIIGVFGDQVKLIKADFLLGLDTIEIKEYMNSSNNSYFSKYRGKFASVPLYYWSGSSSNISNVWANSTLNTQALNNLFLGTFDSTWQEKIATTSWLVQGASSTISNQVPSTVYIMEVKSQLINTTTIEEKKIGLMYASDYYYGALPVHWTKVGYNGTENDYRYAVDDNWMYMGIDEWTISRDLSTNYSAIAIFNCSAFSDTFVSAHGVRPCFYLNSEVLKTGGSGTYSDPYKIA